MIFTQEYKTTAFNALLSRVLKETDKSIYLIENTCDKNNDGYDCLAIQKNKQTGLVSKKMFFEGVYTDSYSTLFISKERLDLLKSVVDNLETDYIYYVNFTPRNTFIFDLFKLELDGKLLFMEDSAYLDITDATTVEFSYVLPSLLHVNLTNQNQVLEEDPILENELKRYKKNENGEIVFQTPQEFTSAPYQIKMLHLMERYIKLNLLPTEDKKEMLEKHGGTETLYLFLKERARNNFLSKPKFAK